jgi:hypothetical protein
MKKFDVTDRGAEALYVYASHENRIENYVAWLYFNGSAVGRARRAWVRCHRWQLFAAEIDAGYTTPD